MNQAVNIWNSETCFRTKDMEIFYWVDLRKVPAWNVFDQLTLISNYIISQKK